MGATEEDVKVEIPAPVSSSYCKQHEVQLIVKEKLFSFPCGRFTIKDDEGTLLFDVKCKDFLSWRRKRVLTNESGEPKLLLKSMCPSFYSDWAAYRGDDETDAQLLFTIRKSALFQFRPSFDVSLRTKTDASKPDFTVKGNFWHTTYTVLYKDNPIAKAKKRCFSTKNVLTVYPGADRAFISALVIILSSQLGCKN